MKPRFRFRSTFVDKAICPYAMRKMVPGLGDLYILFIFFRFSLLCRLGPNEEMPLKAPRRQSDKLQISVVATVSGRSLSQLAISLKRGWRNFTNWNDSGGLVRHSWSSVTTLHLSFPAQPMHQIERVLFGWAVGRPMACRGHPAPKLERDSIENFFYCGGNGPFHTPDHMPHRNLYNCFSKTDLAVCAIAVGLCTRICIYCIELRLAVF